jgi:peptidyl-prolyl cis-trans isomerase C
VVQSFGLALSLGVGVLCGAGGGCGGDGKKSGGGAKSSSGPAVAEIDDIKITIEDFADRINKQSPYIRSRYTSLERKKEFLDNLVRFEVMAKEAEKKGYDKDPEVVRSMKQVMIQKLMKEEFDNRLKLEDIKDDECKTFYDQHPEEYNKPEEVRASAIFTKDAKKAADIHKKVSEKAKKDVVDSNAFGDLAKDLTEDEKAKPSRGDLRYFDAKTTQYPKEVVEAAFALKEVGNFSKPVKAGEGYYVLSLTGRRKALTRSFDEVKRQIQNRLYRDKRTKAMEDYVAELKRKANVKVNEDNLNKVQVDTSMGTPGAPPPGAQPVPVTPLGAGGAKAPPAPAPAH